MKKLLIYFALIFQVATLADHDIKDINEIIGKTTCDAKKDKYSHYNFSNERNITSISGSIRLKKFRYHNKWAPTMRLLISDKLIKSKVTLSLNGTSISDSAQNDLYSTGYNPEASDAVIPTVRSTINEETIEVNSDVTFTKRRKVKFHIDFSDPSTVIVNLTNHNEPVMLPYTGDRTNIELFCNTGRGDFVIENITFEDGSELSE